MTDERREDIRRSEDQIVNERLDEHIAKVDSHIDDFNEFRDQFNDGSFLLPHGKTAMETVMEHRNLDEGQDRILDVLMGPKELQTDGSKPRNEKKGLEHKVEKIGDQLSNGGIKIHIPPTMWALLLVIVAGLFSIGAAMIQNIPNIPNVGG